MMPVRRITESDIEKTSTKLLIVGPPGSRKTTVAGWLAELGPTAVYSMPGEAHTRKVLKIRPNLAIFQSGELNTSAERTDWVKLWDEIRVQTRKLVGDKNGEKINKPEDGEFKHVVFDGYHKAWDVVYQAGVQKFSTSNGVDGYKVWDFAGREYIKWLQQGIFSPCVDWCIWMGWSEEEKTTDGAKKTSIFPFLPGKMQKNIMGELNVIYQKLEGGIPYWQLQQTEDAMGIGIRVTEERAKTMPVRIKADWAKLKGILLG